MKAIMISIKPQHLVNILNGDKTIEVRKNKALASATKKMIDEQGYAQFIAYCSKNNKDYLYRDFKHWFVSHNPKMLVDFKYNKTGLKGHFNGKVICNFKCYKAEEIEYRYGHFYFTEQEIKDKEYRGIAAFKSCLTQDELHAYLQGKNGSAIHISDLHIFDKPKELNDFARYKTLSCVGCCEYCENKKCMLTKAPQNMVYVEISNDN